MSAAEHASRIDPGEQVAWRSLEGEAFAAHPSVLTALDPRWETPTARTRVVNIVTGIFAVAVVVVVVAPGIGFGFVLLDAFLPRPSTEATIITCAVSFLIATITVVAYRLDWHEVKQFANPGAERAMLIFVVSGVGAFVTILVRSDIEHFPQGYLWSIAVAVPTVLAIAHTIAMLNQSRKRVRIERELGHSYDPEPIPTEPLRHVRLAVEKLPEADRDAVRADLTAAIDDLERRGVIDGETAGRARGAELGKLPMTVAQGGPIH